MAIALGDGPAYPILGMEVAPPAPKGVATLDENARHGGTYAVKTLWAVAPGAPPDLVVRGRSLLTGAPLTILVPAGPAATRRGRTQERVDHLTLATRDGEWAYGVTTTLIPGPGCYAFRVVGGGVDDELVFRAAPANEGPTSRGQRTRKEKRSTTRVRPWNPFGGRHLPFFGQTYLSE